MNGNARWLQWVIGGLLIIAMAVSGYAVNKLDTKADKADVQCSLGRIEADMRVIQSDIKELLRRR